MHFHKYNSGPEDVMPSFIDRPIVRGITHIIAYFLLFLFVFMPISRREWPEGGIIFFAVIIIIYLITDRRIVNARKRKTLKSQNEVNKLH